MLKATDILKNWDKSIFDTYIKYNSQADGELIERQISPKGDSYIHFEHEGVIARIKQADKLLELYSTNSEAVISVKIPEVTDGRQAYVDLCCGVQGDEIVIKLPVYQWIDNYPHCDGEYDRWDTRTLGYHTVKIDSNAGNAEIVLYDPS